MLLYIWIIFIYAIKMSKLFLSSIDDNKTDFYLTFIEL